MAQHAYRNLCRSSDDRKLQLPILIREDPAARYRHSSLLYRAMTEVLTSSSAAIILREPSASLTITADPGSVSVTPPSLDWLSGTWHVTHSTLPMWKSKRNVAITYNPQAQASPQKIDDVVSYQGLTSDKMKTVVGVDTICGSTGAWNWRGKGWLMIASSHWEVLGYGDLDDGHQWAVTFFAKTMFTPAGVDVYSRKKEGLSEEVLAKIKGALTASEDENVKELAGQIFEVKRD